MRHESGERGLSFMPRLLRVPRPTRPPGGLEEGGVLGLDIPLFFHAEKGPSSNPLACNLAR